MRRCSTSWRRRTHEGRAGEAWGQTGRVHRRRSRLARSASLGGTSRDEPDPSGPRPTMRKLALIALLCAAPVAAQPVDPYADDPKPQPSGPTDPYADDPKPAPADPYADEPTTTAPKSSSRALDLGAVQGILAVQSLDGWLLSDKAQQNPTAIALVAPVGTPTYAWF